MKLWEIIELVILSKMIPISTNLVQGAKSYGPPKIAIFGFTQALKPGCRTVSNNVSGSGLVPAQNILAVQVWFGFT